MRARSVDKLSLKMGLAISSLLVMALAVSFLLLYRQYWDQVLQRTRQHVLAETALVQQALEHQMLRNDRSLIRSMIDEFTGASNIERIMILDRVGQVAFSSDPTVRSEHFEPESPTCQVCHRLAPAERSLTTTLELDSGMILRCVRPIANHERCHACHRPDHRINGVLIADVSLEPVRRQLERDTIKMATGLGVLGLFLLGGLALFFRRLVMRRLRRFEEAARAVAAGDLGRRVPVGGEDALGVLERQFNRMTDSIAKLVGEVREQQQRLEAVANSIADGIVVLDNELRVVTANSAFWRRCAGQPAEMVGRSCQETVGGKFCSGEAPCLARECLAKGVTRVAIRTRRHSAGICYEEVQASPIFDERGRAVRCVEVWRDISERRSAEARLAGYQKLASLSMLGAGFAHELNTPLATIQFALESVCRTLAGGAGGAAPEQCQQQLHLAREQIERCRTIIEQFLGLARGQAPAEQVMDLAGAVEGVLALAGSTARLASVRVATAGELPRLPVLANPGSVQQVLLNLVLNAIEASPPGSCVELGMYPSGDEVRIEVRDEGKGIPPDDRDRIFEPFFSKRAGGAGLGLFISLGLARQWGGSIRVAERRPRGTIMTVTFPKYGSQDGRAQEQDSRS